METPDDRNDVQFGNEAILPAQWADMHRRRSDLEPLQRLALAVLEDALRLYSRRKLKMRTRTAVATYEEAVAWLFQPDNGPFTFDGVCDLLGFDAEAWRIALRGWDGQLTRRGHTGRVHQIGLARKRVRAKR